MPGTARERRWLKIAAGILSRPTASFLEQMPAAHVRSFAARRPGLELAEDRYGNLLLKWTGGEGTESPPLVLMAHLDHPGFFVKEVDGRVARLEFRGGVRAACAKAGTALEFFRPGSPRPTGRGRLASASSEGARRPGMLAAGTARVTSGTAVAGGYTMWAFPGWSVRNGRIVSRCCDDLLGAAAALVTLDEVHRTRPPGARVWGFFTRAEEVGLLGATAGIRAKTIPRDARVLSLETSRALPHAPQGGGVIVRVGDARSLFEPRLTAALLEVAGELAAEDPDFRFQRRLMDGGTCEATPFCAAGFRASGVALPLGNYHNMKGLDGGPPGIGPEHVAVSDFVSEVKLLCRLAARSAELPALEARTGAWVAPLSRRAHDLLTEHPL
jgi:endoglucanase